MTRYVVLIAYGSLEWESATEEVRQSYHRDHAAFSSYVAEHGSAALADAEQATTLRHEGGRRDGAVEVTDGPFVETAEQVGGYHDVELPDLDHALAAARLLPAAYTVEVRPTVAIG